MKITVKTQRNNYYDLMVRHILSQMRFMAFDAGSLYTAKSYFEEELKKIPRRSTVIAENVYCCRISEDYKKAEIWHLNSVGIKDRHVATIEPDNSNQ